MKVTVATVGVCSLDIIMQLDEVPIFGEKYRAREAAIVGGGGAATAAVAACRLGGAAKLLARLGCDPFASLILNELAAEGVDTAHVSREASLRSSFSSVLVDAQGERQVVNYRDPAMDAATPAASPAASLIASLDLGEYDIALADTRWPEGAAALFRDARGAGKLCVLDGEAPVRHANEALELATHIVFSAAGLRDLTGVDALDAGLLRAGEEFGGFVAVTCGAGGVLWLDANQVSRVPGFVVSAVDTLGAGDVWHGAFALALGECMPSSEAMRFANAAAALKCTRLGGRAGAPNRCEVERLLGG